MNQPLSFNRHAQRAIALLRGLGLSCLAFAWMGFPAQAAAIKMAKGPDGDVVTVSGPIGVGDDDRFAVLVNGLASATVVLDSSEGSLDDAVGIGMTISARGFATVTMPRKSCSDLCALVWLAGRSRGVAPGSSVVLTPVWRSGGEIVQSVASARIGDYLATIRVPSGVASVMNAGPLTLSPDLAEKIGLIVDRDVSFSPRS